MEQLPQAALRRADECGSQLEVKHSCIYTEVMLSTPEVQLHAESYPESICATSATARDMLFRRVMRAPQIEGPVCTRRNSKRRKGHNMQFVLLWWFFSTLVRCAVSTSPDPDFGPQLHPA